MDRIDIQINGAFGVDFNDPDLTRDKLQHACSRLVEIGVIGFLPTIITDELSAMCSKIRTIVALKQSGFDHSQAIAGVHVEGPFLSDQDGYFGTHPRSHLRSASIEDCDRILKAGQGHIRLMTLAPERDPGGHITKHLVNNNVSVFAGHTDASRDQLKCAIDQGLTGFTHLGNGCARQVDRHDNILNRVLAEDRLKWISLIADDIHVPFWLLKSWIDRIGLERCIIISDAISAAGMPPGDYTIGQQVISVDSSGRTKHREHGYLAGSATLLDRMDRLLDERMQFSAEARRSLLYLNAQRMLTNNPD